MMKKSKYEIEKEKFLKSLDINSDEELNNASNAFDKTILAAQLKFLDAWEDLIHQLKTSMPLWIRKLICKIYGHKWKKIKSRFPKSGELCECVVCSKQEIKHFPPEHINCRCVLTKEERL